VVRGCAIHGRTAVPVRRRCLDSSCSTQSFLLARKVPLGYAGEPSPVWLGMSVGDVTDHLSALSGLAGSLRHWVFFSGSAKRVGLQGNTALLAILAKNQTEPENAVSRFPHFQCLTGIENGGASCPAGAPE
jgi:hypothetical protein